MSEKSFEGFSGETLSFLIDLGINNNRSWMERNRDRYRIELLEPFRALVKQLGPSMERIDPFIDVRPQVGKTISRISRDARRNKGKPPYRTNMWFTFRVPGPDWKDSPGFFFELFPDWYRYGMGFYLPSRATMVKLSEEIEKNPVRFVEKTKVLRDREFLSSVRNTREGGIGRECLTAFPNGFSIKISTSPLITKSMRFFYPPDLSVTLRRPFPRYRSFTNTSGS